MYITYWQASCPLVEIHIFDKTVLNHFLCVFNLIRLEDAVYEEIIFPAMFFKSNKFFFQLTIMFL